MSATDLELLARYTRQNAEDAFAEIVRRHLDLVHSAALRQVRSPQLAEEVAQSTFINLARNAHRLASDTILTAWLYQVTRREAIDVVRREARRQLREQTASEMNAINATAADWTHIEPLLDEAMHALDDADRTAVLLRYFENKSLREVGATLGTSDDAAQKRVSRAVERLREFFAKRGVTVATSGLVIVISANAVQAAPIGLVVTISAAALAGTAIAATTATAVKAIAMTTTQKLLVATIVVASAMAPVLVQHRAQTKLAEQDRALRRQADQLAELRKENERLANLIAEANSTRSLPADQFNELLRLRGQVGRLNRNVQELIQLKTVSSATESNVLAATAKVWSERAEQLKQWLEANPAGKIPELQFLTDQDWIEAIHPLTLGSDEEYRRAMSTARANAEVRIFDILHGALRQYGQANNGQFPRDLSQLSPYFKSPLDDAILDRYEIVRADSLVSELQPGEDLVITQKTPVDEAWDARVTIGMTNGGTADSTVTNRWVKTR